MDFYLRAERTLALALILIRVFSLNTKTFLKRIVIQSTQIIDIYMVFRCIVAVFTTSFFDSSTDNVITMWSMNDITKVTNNSQNSVYRTTNYLLLFCVWYSKMVLHGLLWAIAIFNQDGGMRNSICYTCQIRIAKIIIIIIVKTWVHRHCERLL